MTVWEGWRVGVGENMMFESFRSVIKEIEKTATCRWDLIRITLKNRVAFCILIRIFFFVAHLLVVELI